MKQRVVVGISGASGAAIGLRILERLAAIDTIETHLVVSGAAETTLNLDDSYERVMFDKATCYRLRNGGA